MSCSEISAISVNAREFFDQVVFPLNRVLDPLFGRWFGKNLTIVAERA